MELSWITRTKITLSALVGILLIGFAAYPMVKPHDYQYLIYPPNFYNYLMLLGLAVISGFIAYFVSWPYGREVGLISVPAGLGIWALRSGSMFDYLQLNPSLDNKINLYSSMQWQPIFWLIVVLFGFLGVLLAQKLKRPASAFPAVVNKYYFGNSFSQLLFLLKFPIISRFLKMFGYENLSYNSEKKPILMQYLTSSALSFFASILVSYLCLRIFAQSLTASDSKLGTVFSQASSGQILFGTMVSFGFAAFLIKKFLNASFIWPVLASIFVMPLLNTASLKQGILGYLTNTWPSSFFVHPAAYILPIQLIAFGTLGSILGFWLVVRYRCWRELES